MKLLAKKDKRTELEKEIDSLLKKMHSVDPCSPEYEEMADVLEKLYKAKSYEKSRKVSPDTLAITLCNLAGIGLVLFREQAGHLVNSKALAFIKRV